MRVAVESGWVRARKTRMAANVVSLLSALVLYIFATGVVKGFGFALGLSTLIDLAVLFWFTKPFVSCLARFRFFNGGGELSGLSAATLGMDEPRHDARREGLMGKFSRLGNDLYGGRRSIDFVGRRALWYAVSLVLVGAGHRGDRASRASTSASSSPAARSTASRVPASRGHPGQRRRAQRRSSPTPASRAPARPR